MNNEQVTMSQEQTTNKYLGKINWIFAHCGRLYLWVAVRCAQLRAALSARTLQWESGGRNTSMNNEQ